MYTEDNVIGALVIAFFACVGVAFLLGSRVGFDAGIDNRRNETIVFCMEQQQKCKISYDYLKLQKQLKNN